MGRKLLAGILAPPIIAAAFSCGGKEQVPVQEQEYIIATELVTPLPKSTRTPEQIAWDTGIYTVQPGDNAEKIMLRLYGPGTEALAVRFAMDNGLEAYFDKSSNTWHVPLQPGQKINFIDYNPYFVTPKDTDSKLARMAGKSVEQWRLENSQYNPSRQLEAGMVVTF